MLSESETERDYRNFASEQWQLINDDWNLSNHTESVLVTIGGNNIADWHNKTFERSIKVAKDSGGFALLMKPQLAKSFDLDKLIRQHKLVGYYDHDIILSADFPIPRNMGLSDEEIRYRQQKSVDWYNLMKSEIPQTIPVIHGTNTEEFENHIEMYGLKDKETVAVGSNLAQSTPRVLGQTGHKIVSRSILWKTIREMMSVMRKHEFDSFLLGAGGMSAAPEAALLGTKFTDATSWRLNAYQWALFCPERRQYIHCGDKKNNLEKEWVENYLRECLEDENYPLGRNLAGNDYRSLIEALRGVNRTGTEGSRARQIHNLYVQEKDAEWIRTYEDDPEGLGKALIQQHELNSEQGWRNSAAIKRIRGHLDSIRESTVSEDFELIFSLL